MSYQAVIRNSSNSLVVNTQVGMQISILQTTDSGTAVYVETQIPTTNINGLVSLAIGSGTTTGHFSAIDWSAGPYFIKTETDPTGGSSYSIIGTSQLMSVPYALYAANSGTAGVPYTGASSEVDLGAHDLTVNGLTVGKGAGAISSNVVLGKSAMRSNESGGYSVAVGFEALKSNTDGNSNTAIGHQALAGNTTGGANIAIGMNSMSKNTIGQQNIAIGQSTLYNNSEASGNTVIGNSAGVEITTGGYNTIVGHETAGGLSTGSGNTIIGRNAYTGNISNNIVLSNGIGEIKARHNGTNWTLTGGLTAGGISYPSVNGTSGQVLTTNGSGTASWTSPASSNSGSSLPVVTTSARDVLGVAASGNLVFNTTTNTFQGSKAIIHPYDYYTTNNYGFSEIIPGHSITQTFTAGGQTVSSAKIAIVNMGSGWASNSGDFTFAIHDDVNNYNLFSTTITVSGAGDVTVPISVPNWINMTTVYVPLKLPVGTCSFVISSASNGGGSANFLLNGIQGVGTTTNTYWQSKGGTSAGYTNPDSSHPLSIALYPTEQTGIIWVDLSK
jgi:hypothetical protein